MRRARQGGFYTVADYVYMELLSPARRRQLVLSERATHAVGIAPRPPDEHGRVRYAVVEYTVFPPTGAAR